MSVRAERSGRVTTVILDRPGVRNAVDGPAAAALAGAFRDFDADDGADVAVLWGAGGTFCAGADLKAVGGPDGNRASPDGDGPMGPTRMQLGKPVIAAIRDRKSTRLTSTLPLPAPLLISSPQGGGRPERHRGPSGRRRADGAHPDATGKAGDRGDQ